MDISLGRRVAAIVARPRVAARLLRSRSGKEPRSIAIDERRTTQARIVAPDEVVGGEAFGMMGVHMLTKATGAETDGAFSMIAQHVQPGGGWPLHTADKLLYDFGGMFLVGLDGEQMRAMTGTTAITPRGVVHDFKNVGEAMAMIMAIVAPAGHEQFLSDLAEVVAGGAPAREVMSMVVARHNVETVRGK